MVLTLPESWPNGGPWANVRETPVASVSLGAITHIAAHSSVVCAFFLIAISYVAIPSCSNLLPGWRLHAFAEIKGDYRCKSLATRLNQHCRSHRNSDFHR